MYGSPDLYHVLRRLRNTLEAGPAGSRAGAVVIIAGRISDSGADRCVLSLGDRDGMAGKLFDALMGYVKDNSLKIIPSCSYIEKKLIKLPNSSDFLHK